MGSNLFRVLILPLAVIAKIVFAAENREWLRTHFKPADIKYKYFVGVSQPLGSQQDAIRQARENAWDTLGLQEFATRAKIRYRSTESTEVVNAERGTSVNVDFDVSEMELIDQELETIPGDVPTYVAKLLFRYEKEKIESQRQKILAREKESAINDTNDQESLQENQRLKEDAIRERQLREKETNELRKKWKDVFPKLGFDVSLGYFWNRDMSSFGGSLGLRAEVFESFYLGGFYSYGKGDDRMPKQSDSTQSTSNEPKSKTSSSIDSDVFIKSGFDLKYYFVRNVNNGLYLRFLKGIDQLHITCEKDLDGNCSTPMPKNQTGKSYGGSLGINKISEWFKNFNYWFECTITKNSNDKIGVSGSLSLGTTWGLK